MTELLVPSPSLVALVGVAGCGKSTFAARHFAPTEVVSSDRCRALVADDERDQSATRDAFDVLHLIVDRRLARMRLTVVDATNVKPRARRPLLAIARRNHLPAVAIVLDLPAEVCVERDRGRDSRRVGAEVIALQRAQLEEGMSSLRAEGFRDVHVLRSAAAVDGAVLRRVRLEPDRRDERGPFDIVGDVHGCVDELEELLARLGWERDADGVHRHPGERRLIFLGDLVDRGPRIVDALRLAMAAVEVGRAFCLPGNHDDKLRRKLRGRAVQVRHGLETTLEQLAATSPEFQARVADFIERLPSHLVLDEGRLVVAHGGMREALQGRDDPRVRDFALYGETTGTLDEQGLPIRTDWAASYGGAAIVVYGHTPVREPEWLNRTINIDTGCVYGGGLTALRYPELELVTVPARRRYRESKRRLLPPRSEMAASASMHEARTETPGARPSSAPAPAPAASPTRGARG